MLNHISGALRLRRVALTRTWYQSLEELANIAISIGNETALTAALEKGASAKAVVNGVPLLTQAASRGHVGMIRSLIAKGADLNAKQSAPEQIPIIAAAANNQFDIIPALISLQADVRAGNNRLFTILLDAGRLELAELAFTAGTGINDMDERGQLIFKNILDRHIMIQERLLTAGCDLEIPQLKLVESFYDRSLKLLVYMLAEGFDQNQKLSDDGGTALHYAAQRGAWPVVQTMLARKANSFATNKNGKTPIMLAIGYQQPASKACSKGDVDLGQEFRGKHEEQRRAVLSAFLSAMLDGQRS
jgi:ankyrin repeat protein